MDMFWSNLSSLQLSWSGLGWMATAAGFSSVALWIGWLQQRLRRSEQELERVRASSRTDSLTGLGSQRYFDTERWPRAVRDATVALTVAFIDLDGLRALNNGLGHDAGDHLIQRAAAAIQSVARGGYDEAFRRYNAGDEFVVLFRGTADAAALGGRLVAALKAAGVMASIGLDCCDAYDRVRRRALLANAEASMRTAKSAGGGGLAVYAGGPADEGAGDRQRAVDLPQNGQRSMPGALVTA